MRCSASCLERFGPSSAGSRTPRTGMSVLRRRSAKQRATRKTVRAAPASAQHHQNSMAMVGCCRVDTIARTSAFTVAEIPSIRDELRDRSGFANIRLSLYSLVVRQLAFQRKMGWAPWWSLPATRSSSRFFEASLSIANPCRISTQVNPFVTNDAEIWREFQGSKQIS
jgi:hypothetical protein